jgi:hypothetical protein
VEESLVQQQSGESSSSQGNAEGKKKSASKADMEAKLRKMLNFGKKK